MLQNIREKSQGWFAWTVIIAVCLTFALWGINSYFHTNAATEAIAKVNGTEITRQTFTMAYQQSKRRDEIRLGSSLSNIDKSAVLNALISDLLLQQAAKKGGFRASNELAELTIAKMPIFQANGVFSRDRFQRILSGLFYTPEQFMAQLKNDMIAQQVDTGLDITAFGLPNEIEQTAKLVFQKRHFRYIILPISHYLKDVSISDDAIKQYYQAHQDDFKTEEKISLDYLLLSLKKSLTEQQFSTLGDQLANLTYENPNTLETASQQLNLPIQHTELFSRNDKLAGWLANPKIKSLAFSQEILAGNNSDLINLDENTTIVIRLKQRIPSAVKPLESVRAVILDKLKKIAAQEKAKQEGDALVSKLQQGKSVENLDWHTASFVTKEDKSVDSSILQAAFDLPRPSAPNTPSIIGIILPSSDYAIISLSDIQLGNLSNLSTGDQQKFNRGISDGRGKLDNQLYQEALSQQAKIIKYESFHTDLALNPEE